MQCGEYLLDNPTNIQNYCFDHMCTDLHKSNVAERMDNVIQVVIGKRKNFIEAAPESIWRRIQSTFSKATDMNLINGLVVPVVVFLLCMIFIRFIDAETQQLIDPKTQQLSSEASNPSSPYGTTLWMLLLTLGSMVQLVHD